MDRLAEKDWNNVKCIFHHLRSTINYGLRYTRGSGELKVFSDADFAGDKVILMLHHGHYSCIC